jgi:hypothetical protein
MTLPPATRSRPSRSSPNASKSAEPPEDTPAGRDRNGPPPFERRVLRQEVWIVLGLSLAASALCALFDLTRDLTSGQTLKAQQTVVNTTAGVCRHRSGGWRNRGGRCRDRRRRRPAVGVVVGLKDRPHAANIATVTAKREPNKSASPLSIVHHQMTHRLQVEPKGP